MLKPKVVMLMIKKKLKRNQKSFLRMQSILRTSLPTSMEMRENLGYRNQCIFLVRNTNLRKKHTTTSFVNG
jgi:hypothetical protein